MTIELEACMLRLLCHRTAHIKNRAASDIRLVIISLAPMTWSFVITPGD